MNLLYETYLYTIIYVTSSIVIKNSIVYNGHIEKIYFFYKRGTKR